MSIKLYSTVIGQRKYAFGILALRRFTEAMGCAPGILNVHPTFQGATQIGAIIEMVRAGAEQATDERLTERQASDIVETLTDGEQAELVDLFFSSIVGQPFNDFLQELEQRAAQAEQTGQTGGESDEKKPLPLLSSGDS